MSSRRETDWELARRPGAVAVAALMLVALPLVAIQGPAHTTPMDAVNLLFVGVYWSAMLVRGERPAFPLIAGFWLVVLGGCLGTYGAEDQLRALLVLVEDIYLYLWFATLTHFLARRMRPGDVALLWVAVACLVASVTVADGWFGLFGGRFAGLKRATGTFENPNMFGDYLVVSFFVAWATAAGGRWLAYLALPLLLLGIRSTASNGCMVSLLAGLVVMIVAYPTFWKPRQIGLVLVLAAICMGVVGVFHQEIEQFAMERFSAGRSEVGGAVAKGASERLPIWENIFRQVLDRPTGVGPGNFGIVDAMTTGDVHAAHSEYLGMLAERGVVGLAGWLGILGGIGLMIDRLRRAAGLGFRPLGIPQLFGLYGAMGAHALVIELSHFRHTWMVFALLAGAATQAATVLRAAPVAAPLRRAA